MRTRFSSGSKVYVGAPIGEDTGIDITTDAVVLAYTLTQEEVDDPGTVWTTGVWKTIRGRTWAVALIGPGSVRGALTPARYWVSVRVTDNPEIPILTAPNQITIY